MPPRAPTDRKRLGQLVRGDRIAASERTVEPVQGTADLMSVFEKSLPTYKRVSRKTLAVA
jgi:hypothetical protein